MEEQCDELFCITMAAILAPADGGGHSVAAAAREQWPGARPGAGAQRLYLASRRSGLAREVLLEKRHPQGHVVGLADIGAHLSVVDVRLVLASLYHPPWVVVMARSARL